LIFQRKSLKLNIFRGGAMVARVPVNLSQLPKEISE